MISSESRPSPIGAATVLAQAVSSITSSEEYTLTFSAKARRLRHLAVDKGLLREVKAVQRILDSLIRCRVGRPSRARCIGLMGSFMTTT